MCCVENKRPQAATTVMLFSQVSGWWPGRADTQKIHVDLNLPSHLQCKIDSHKAMHRLSFSII